MASAARRRLSQRSSFSSGGDQEPAVSPGSDQWSSFLSDDGQQPNFCGGDQQPPSGGRDQPRSSGVCQLVPHQEHTANWEGAHLWLYMQGLGFDLKDVGSDVNLGPTMFKKPNASAFYIVATFLFAKLDESRAAQVFKNCSVGAGTMKATEFRKKCCLWLGEIAKKDRSQLPKFAPSALTSPGGPKFIDLMYRLARHAVLEDMKRNSTGTDIPFAEDVELPHEDVYMASARCRIAYNKLLQFFQEEDFIIQSYKKKEQLLIEEIKQIKSKFEVLQIEYFKMKQNGQNKSDKTETIQKVRSMWALIIKVLTSLKKEKEIVDYVLKGCVGHYVLDGASVVFRIPRLLAQRVETDVHQHWSGNVYEGEKLNFLTVIQLLNEALRTLRDEICQSELKSQLGYIKNITVKCTQKLQNLQSIRLKLKEQHYASRSESILRKQEDWEAKWKNFLGLCPLDLMLEQNPELDILRASPLHSFDPSEDEDDDSILFQHLLSVPGVYDSVHEVCHEKDGEALEATMDKSTPASRRISSVPVELPKACENRDTLIEKNLPTEPCKGEEMTVPPKILKNGKDESAISETSENTGDHVTQTESSVKEEDPLKKSSDELAEEIARRVVSVSPQSGQEKGMALEDILSSLAFNPFLTRKQIPRTPENLLTEIRSSWRKAVQTEDSSDVELSPAKVMVEEAPVDAGPIVQKVVDSGLMNSIPASPVPDCDPLLSEGKPLLSSMEFRPQDEISCIIESQILETSGVQENERIGEQEFKCIGSISVQDVNSAEDPEQSSSCVNRSMNAPNSCSENNSKINILRSDHFWGSLTDRMLNQNVSPLLSASNHKASWILDETFPEELDIKFTSSDSDFDEIDIGGAKNKGDIQESKLDVQFLFSPHKALRKTVSTSEEELYQTHNRGECVSYTSDQNLKPEKRERDDLCHPLEVFCLDEAFIKTLSPTSNEKKYSLSSLLVSRKHLEELASMADDIPLNVIAKLKDTEQLNEETGTKEPSSG